MTDQIKPSAEVLRKVSKAKALLILDHPFFGMTVSRRPLIFTTDIPTAGMSSRGQMSLNPTWVEQFTVKKFMFLLAHEALHYMLEHGPRKGTRVHKRWNVACDRVINDILIHEGVGDFIEGGELQDDARNLSAEIIYTTLEDEDGEDGPGPGGIGNDVDQGGAMDDAERHEIETQVKLETLAAAKAAKAMGRLPASISRIVDEMLNVPTPWHEILSQFMLGRVRDGYSWSRPNRRFIGSGLYLPGYDYVPKMGEVVIGVDTSGSIGQRELNEFNAHINRIMDMCNPEKVTVIYCDAQVSHIDEYQPEDYPVALTARGGGGTSFRPVFEYVEENGISPEVVVYLTDGYGDQNSFESPAYHTVWLTTGSEDFSWGTVVKFESEGH